MSTLGRIGLGFAGLVAGFLAGFFTAGPTLFADGPFGQRLISSGLVLAGFGLVGLLAGGIAPKERWLPFVCAAGVLPIAIGIPLLDGAPAALWGVAALCIALAVIGSWVGALAGRRIRTGA